MTALFAATIALTQTDLKRILAYSTISQLGYMFLAVGVGAYASGIFHLVTHAFFKALLFLAAGSVMHALAGELDIRKMGNLRAKMPVTYWTFLIGAAALAGIPLFSGFFSKDEILWYAWQKSPLLWVVGVVTAPDRDLLRSGRSSCRSGGRSETSKLFNHAHESPRVMTVPLIILAVGAALAGYVGIPHLSAIEGWLEPVFASRPPRAAAVPAVARGPLEWVLLAVSALVALGGAVPRLPGLSWWTPSIPKRVRASLGWFADAGREQVLRRRSLQCGLRAAAARPGGLVRRQRRPARHRRRGERRRRASPAGSARRCASLQTGLVGLYALSILFGAVALLAWLVRDQERYCESGHELN